MPSSYSDAYKDAGVDITAGYKSVELIKKHIERTRTPGFTGGLGGFGGLFMPDLRGIAEPVLVSGTDGVGTKLRLAFLLNKHNTVGIDCTAMCVNDIICALARPLFFLDYIACGKNTPEKIAAIVEGIAEGCVQAGCALIGGETAEMPGFYAENEYDLAGFSVGLTSRERIPKPEDIQQGDAVIALPSGGVHSNGFSLVRKVFALDGANAVQTLASRPAGLDCTLGEALLAPTRIYVKPVLALADKIKVLGLAHITGGGFYENMPRCLPQDKSIRIFKKTLRIPAIFRHIQETGIIPERDMFNTFNMGVGMILIVNEKDTDSALSILSTEGEDAYIAGVVEAGERGVVIE
ncbi:MAG: phosphoribosylformylglycinamidine cyclo-ligase [Spirochaetaceae bacterium]|jgi:phosphoribosylformylglycinamidine cyclo-ligase|nr:phosphoribosylformylglycinamidine cyclo-ligase [Spirochaetaceae bacterium]